MLIVRKPDESLIVRVVDYCSIIRSELSCVLFVRVVVHHRREQVSYVRVVPDLVNKEIDVCIVVVLSAGEYLLTRRHSVVYFVTLRVPKSSSSVVDRRRPLVHWHFSTRHEVYGVTRCDGPPVTHRPCSLPQNGVIG